MNLLTTPYIFVFNFILLVVLIAYTTIILYSSLLLFDIKQHEFIFRKPNETVTFVVNNVNP